MNIFNLFDIKNVIDIYPLTGEPDNPGTYYRNPEIENLPRLKEANIQEAIMIDHGITLVQEK